MIQDHFVPEYHINHLSKLTWLHPMFLPPLDQPYISSNVSQYTPRIFIRY